MFSIFKDIAALSHAQVISINKIYSIYFCRASSGGGKPRAGNRKRPGKLFPAIFLCYNGIYQTMKGEPTMAKDKDKGKEKSNKPKLSIKDKKKKKKEKLERKLAGL